MTPRSIHLTQAEVAQIEREMLTLDHQAEDLRAGVAVEVVIRRIQEVAAGVRYLLDRAVARRGVQ